MVRHLVIAALCLETAVVVGGGVVVGQLWFRSEQAEQRTSALSDELDGARQQLAESRQELRRVVAQSRVQGEQLSSSTADDARWQAELSQLRDVVDELEQRHAALLARVDQTAALRARVARLEEERAERESSLGGREGDSPQEASLAQGRGVAPTSASQPILFDDSGWRTVPDSLSGIVSAAPSEVTPPTVVLSPSYYPPPLPVVILPPGY